MSSLNRFSFIVLFAALLIFMSFVQMLRNAGGQRLAGFCARGQVFMLLLSSYVFLCRGDLRFGICVAIETVIAYGVGLMLAKSGNMQRKKRILAAGVAVILLMLGYFKYCSFFLNGFLGLMGRNDALQIILPIGISFYSFTAISYMVDVARGVYKEEQNFLNVALFMSFFPKVTAGPIVRGDCFLPQIRDYKGIKPANCRDGIQIFMFGLFKKIVLADHLGVFVDDVFFSPRSYHTLTVALAVFSYALQIYFDFSGYSDMAVGMSKMLGFEFPRNFNLPYISKNLSEFWRRWHISLSSWLQDYLYVPLGGNRKGAVRSYANLMAVMLLSGLWHGRGWNFIAWGFLHGIGSCIHKWKAQRKPARARQSGFCRMMDGAATFVTVALLWVFFRAESCRHAIDVFAALFTCHGGIVQPYTWTFFSVFVLALSTAAACVRQKGAEQVDGFYPVLSLHTVGTLTVFFVFAGLTIMLGYFGNTAFIYERF